MKPRVAVIGRAKGRITLPAQLWHALLTTDRLYSKPDIATLRTAIPILQFARARMVEFADHGPGHALHVKSYASQLGHVMGLNQTEQGLLRAGALFHDVGNAVDRERHNILSEETVIRLTANGELPFSAEEADVVGLLCRWHRREYDPSRVDTLDGDAVRTGLLASILRVADAMDIDQRRSDYSDRFYRIFSIIRGRGTALRLPVRATARVRPYKLRRRPRFQEPISIRLPSGSATMDECMPHGSSRGA
ncbi:MAG: HD domain-containing protein [Chloroflexi bacterium]|nr:HD domain-containing protein [Chloroflexota bacterium]